MFVNVLLMYLFSFTAADIVSSVVIYFMTYYIGRGSEANYVNGTLLVMQVLSLPFYLRLSRRTSKRRAFITGLAIWMVAMIRRSPVSREPLLMEPAVAWIVERFHKTRAQATVGIGLLIWVLRTWKTEQIEKEN